MRRCGPAACLLFVFLSATSCGKEGPPLPPLVRLPAAPADIRAARRGESVEITLAVPSTNTDGTRPANVQRVDLYAATVTGNITDDQFLKLGTKVGSVEVKAPRDPNATVDPDEPASDAELPQGPGLNQGATATFTEELTSKVALPVTLTQTDDGEATEPAPLSGPPVVPLSRTYAAVGISTRGRPGPLSRRSSVPLVPAPGAPPDARVKYDESTITVTWMPPAARRPIQEAPSGDVLPSRLIGFSAPTVAFNVYEIGDKTETRLTNSPSTEPRFVDTRIEWGIERCYGVRAIEIYDSLSVESELSPARCVKLTDIFAPKAPVGATAVASEGAINLIWDPNTESDLAGYVVLRGTGASQLTPITPAPIQQPSFRDAVQPGARYTYAIRAVDKAGNASELSNQTEAAEAR